MPDRDVTLTARIRAIRTTDSLGPYQTFGIVARASDAGSDAFGVCPNCFRGSLFGLSVTGFEQPLASRTFDPKKAWHVYALQVRGANLIGTVDGREVFDITETSQVGGSGFGLWSSGVAIEVSSFEITSLD